MKTTDTTSAELLTLAPELRDEAALTGAHDIEIRDGVAYIAGKGYTTRALPSSGVFPYEKGKGGSFAVVDVRRPASPKLLWAAKNPLAYEDAETSCPFPATVCSSAPAIFFYSM